MDKILTKKFFVKKERFFLFFIVFEELKRSFEEMHWARMEPHFNNFGMIRAGGSVNPASLLLPDRRWLDPSASRQEIDTSTPIPWMTPAKEHIIAADQCTMKPGKIRVVPGVLRQAHMVLWQPLMIIHEAEVI
jgi:hypothetical protein